MIDKLLNQYYKGDQRALARLISLVENRDTQGILAMDHIYPKIGHAHIIGFTGPPGAGKSTLINEVIREYRNNNKSVAVIAVDPSSPYSEGALLGDRVRLLEFTSDDGVYIRSMASRGRVGGLSAATFDTVCILDGAGFDIIIVETVGAGQSEVDIIQICDTVIVLTVPGLGDDIQILKAGIMEIADVFVVNKADKIGAEEIAAQIRHFIKENKFSWLPPVVTTSALERVGIDDLVNAIDEHNRFIQQHVNQLRMDQFRTELIRRASESFTVSLEQQFDVSKLVKDILTNKRCFSDTVSELVRHLSTQS
ncbi:MAG: methylmalonyl Co-A mutase-associated GTPase MeaB [Candidatus Heimdallarchaeota archaeon]|nr:methylmalonyl Co-A mutase-associated GTPase MeaB [Candidatus Heimdallarchaeota archaeon]